MKALTLSLVLLTFSAQAQEVEWAKGPFWKAPQIKEMTKTMTSLDKELVESCEQYKKLVESASQREISDYFKRRFEDFRTLPLPSSMRETFQTSFAINDLDQGYYIESDWVVVKGSNEKNADILPMYTQEKAITGISLDDIVDIKVNASANSLTAFSRSLGLTDAKSYLSRSRGKVIIVVEGRDLACDLLTKKAKLEKDLPSNVRLDEKASEEMAQFYYNKISPAINSAISKTNDSLTLKAAKLGFRLGKVLEEKAERIDDEVLEKQITNIMELAFIPKTLNPSSYLVDSDKKKVMNVTSNTKGNKVKFILEVL